MRENEQPWRVRTDSVDRFPRCKRYLAAMGLRMPYPGQTDYWLAVSLSDSFSDDHLAKLGSIDFDRMAGADLLAAFEMILAGGRKSAKPTKAKGIAKPVPVTRITAAVSEIEIEAAKTAKGGWKASTLAGWGVAWPPPRGWRQKLIANYQAEQRG